METNFAPGLELNKGFYKDIVQNLLRTFDPQLKYSAALIGYGSDVIGCDTSISMDHNWGPRMQLFLDENDESKFSKMKDYLSNNLPFYYKGFSTNFTDPRYDFTRTMEPANKYPVNHLIEIYALQDYFNFKIGVEHPNHLSLKNWLGLTDQVLLELTSGMIFYDGLEMLHEYRHALAFYPRDVLLLKLAGLWKGIENIEPFIGRCRDIDDFLGVKLITAKLISLLIRILFYLERKYPPYAKWTTKLFQGLKSFSTFNPLFTFILSENNPTTIEDAFAVIYEKVLDIQNRQNELPIVNSKARYFFNRPYKVIFAETIVQKLVEEIRDDDLKQISPESVNLEGKADSICFRSLRKNLQNWHGVS